VSDEWGAKFEANCVCTVAADLDNDGDLDLVLVNFYTQPVLLRNETNDKNWLRVSAAGTRSSRDGIGAKVSVFDVTGGKRALVGFRQIHSGEGYCRCSPLEAHFGLGKAPAAGYRVEVRFPASGKLVVTENVKPAQRLVVKEE
jgi:enediyne biosynthesis protein E4